MSIKTSTPRTLTLLAIGSVFLAACGFPVVGQATPHDASVAPPPTVTSTSATKKITSSLSPRGLIPKAIGQVAAIGDDATNPDLSFTVDAIAVDDKCTSEFARKPQNGHFVVLSMTVKTSVTMDKTLFLIVAPTDFAVVGPDGVTETNLTSTAAFGCLSDREQFPSQPLGAGSVYVGKVVLDSRNTHGILEYRPPMLVDNSGWEWSF
ncbi:hypothetical protein [Kutzneria kofuensis]|uniref:DUF4352 domain-containing protein n=1 Tax=Kutzneria kofuensis TaxID=103725 RepID=A0A7W9NIP5_9PSEU|nr:hypothetical protein [Kutzneria kofuensis]MBB5893526.1 hypothetical protein [Kutzneria kofuensis]